MVETIQWIDGAVVMIDQTRLPLEEKYVTCRSYQDVATAIRDMTIRGAPAIGVAAAMGVALGVLHASETDLDARTLDTQMEEICATLAATRPTAVNLFWAIDRMKRVYASVAQISSIWASRPVGEACSTPIATPIAAATPIAGAPRIVISRMAAATSW